MEKLNTLRFIEFNKDQKELCCSIINRFGYGQHPIATTENLDGFAVSYLKELLEGKKFIAAEEKLSELGKKTLEEIRAKL